MAKIISTDNAMNEAIKRNLGVDDSKLVVVPNTVQSVLADQALVDADTRSTGSEPPAIVTVGRMVANKGYDNLARALLALEDRGFFTRRMAWSHFGSGPAEATVSKMMSGSRKVSFSVVHGADDESVSSALRSCRIFVQPSRYEGSSLTTLEAMAQGTNVVATPVGGIPDKILDGQTGVLAADTSWQALEDAVARGLALDDNTLGRAARMLVASSFTHKRAMEQYAELYDALEVEM